MRRDLVLARVTPTTAQCRGLFLYVSVSLTRLTLEALGEVEAAAEVVEAAAASVLLLVLVGVVGAIGAV